MNLFGSSSMLSSTVDPFSPPPPPPPPPTSASATDWRITRDSGFGDKPMDEPMLLFAVDELMFLLAIDDFSPSLSTGLVSIDSVR